MKSLYKHLANSKQSLGFKLLMFWLDFSQFQNVKREFLLTYFIPTLGNKIRIIHLIWSKLSCLFLLGSGLNKGPWQECCLFFTKVVCDFRYPWEISWSDSHLFLSKWVLRYRSPSNHVQEGIGPIITSKRNDRC